MLTNWWREVKGNSLHSWLLHLIPSIIIWHIWKAKNKKRFEDKDMSASIIIELVRLDISNINHSYKLQLMKGKCSVACMQYFNLPVAAAYEKLRFVLWEKPPPDTIKLNVD